jgi:hypothetical protein
VTFKKILSMETKATSLTMKLSKPIVTRIRTRNVYLVSTPSSMLGARMFLQEPEIPEHLPARVAFKWAVSSVNPCV